MSILQTGTKALLLLGIVQGLFLAVLLYLRVRERDGRILAALLLTFSLNLALDLAQLYSSNPPWVMPLDIAVNLLIGPLALTYFEAVASPVQGTLSPVLRRHWIFSAVSAGCLIASLIPWYSAWRSAANGRIELASILAALGAALLLIAAVVQQGLCLWAAHHRLATAKAGLPHDSPRDARLAWLDLLVRVLTVLWIAAAASLVGGLVFKWNEVFGEISNLLYGIALYAVGGFALLNPEAFRPPREAVQTVLAKYRKSALTAADVERLLAKLEQEMQRSQAWREGNLSLAALSKRIGASPNDVSQAINQGTGTSFYDYVNRYRIEEAKVLLLDQGDRTVLDIAYQVGFNSKSAFNTAFRKQTGTTPTSFRAGKTSSPTGSNDENPLQVSD